MIKADVGRVRCWRRLFGNNTQFPLEAIWRARARWSGNDVLYINVQRFRGRLVFKAHRLLYHSTLGLRVMKKKKKKKNG